MATYTPVYPVADLGADDYGDERADTDSDVHQAADSGLEAVGLGEECCVECEFLQGRKKAAVRSPENVANIR